MLSPKNGLQKSALVNNMWRYIFTGEKTELYKIYDTLIRLRCVSNKIKYIIEISKFLHINQQQSSEVNALRKKVEKLHQDLKMGFYKTNR